MNKKLLSNLIFGASALGCIWAFAPSLASARWNPDSPTQMKCSKLTSPKKCNKDKECYWDPINPQCMGSLDCSRKYAIDEKACKGAENEGCYWYVPTADDLKHIGYCFEKGVIQEQTNP